MADHIGQHTRHTTLHYTYNIYNARERKRKERERERERERKRKRERERERGREGERERERARATDVRRTRDSRPGPFPPSSRQTSLADSGAHRWTTLRLDAVHRLQVDGLIGERVSIYKTVVLEGALPSDQDAAGRGCLALDVTVVGASPARGENKVPPPLGEGSFPDGSIARPSGTPPRRLRAAAAPRIGCAASRAAPRRGHHSREPPRPVVR